MQRQLALAFSFLLLAANAALADVRSCSALFERGAGTIVTHAIGSVYDVEISERMLRLHEKGSGKVVVRLESDEKIVSQSHSKATVVYVTVSGRIVMYDIATARQHIVETHPAGLVSSAAIDPITGRAALRVNGDYLIHDIKTGRMIDSFIRDRAD